MSVKQKFIDLVLRGKDLLSPVTSKATEEFKKLQGETKQAAEQLKTLETAQAKLATARGLEIYAEQAADALAKAKAEVALLSREIDASGKPTKEQAEALKLAGKSAGQLQTEYNKLTSQLSRSKAELQQSGVNTKNLAGEQDRLQKEVAESNGELQQNRDKLRELGKELKDTSGSSGTFGESVGSLTAKLVAFAGAYVGIRSIKQAIIDVFTAGDQFDRLNIQMTGVMGSIEAGEKATLWIQDFAKNTPLELSEVTQAFVQLRNFGLDPMDGTLAKIIDMSEKLGGGWQKAESISRALGEAWGKQRLQGQEILQLINAGVPVWEMLEKVTGRNAAEVRKLSEAGKIGRDVMRELIDEIGRSAEGQSQQGMQTMTGLISNLRDNITRFYVQISNSGAMDVLKEQLNAVNEQFDRMAKDGTLQKAADQLAQFIASIVKTGGDGLNAAIANVSGFVTFLSITTNSIRIFFNGISSAIFTMAAGVSGAISQIISLVAKLNSAIGATDIAKTLQDQADAIAAVSEAYLQQVEQDGRDIKASWDNITSALSSSSDQVTAKIVSNSAEQAAAITNLNQVEQDRIAQQQKLQDAVNNAGITTLQSLKNIEESAKETYEIIKEAAGAGELSAYEVEQAFNAWADAALKLAAANKSAVPEVVRLEAANLGLGRQLDALIQKQGLSTEFTDQQGRSVSVLRQEIEKTEAAIKLYQQVIASDTASLEEKRLATLRLVDAQQVLKGQVESLAEVEALRTKTYFDVKLALEDAERQANKLTESYKSGSLTTQQYNDQLERQLQIVRALQSMLASAGGSNENHGRQQQETARQVEKTTVAIESQATALKSLQGNTDKATQATSLLAGAQDYLRKQFDFSGSSSQDLSKRYEELTGFISQNRRAHNEWWRELARASNEAFTREQQIISETLAVRNYTDQLKSSSITMEQVKRISGTLNYSFNQLGDNELAPLRNAIADAEKRILTLRDGLQGTLRGLQDELDRLQNNQSQIDKRNYEVQVAELRAKLKDAQAAGDLQSVKAAEQALTLAKQIYDIKTQQQKVEAQAANAANSKNAGAAAPDNKPRFASEVPVLPKNAIISTSTPSQTVRLELAMPSGRAFSAQMAQTDASALLAEIERTRSTSL